MPQPLLGRGSAGPSVSAVSRAFWPVQLRQWSVPSGGGIVWATAGLFQHFVITLLVAPGVGKSWSFAFTNVTTGNTVTVVIADTAVTNRNVANTLSVSPGDVLNITCTPSGTPTGAGDVYVNAEFVSTTAGESGYCAAHAQGNGALSGATAAYYLAGPFAGVTWNTTTPPTNPNIVAIAGNVTRLTGRADAAPGAAKSWTFYLVLNGVVQDGAGGTVNTACVLTGAGVFVAHATFSLPVVPGDILSLKVVTAGTPTSARLQCAITLTATTVGEWQLTTFPVGVSPATNTFNYVQDCQSSDPWVVTEGDVAMPAWVTPFTFDQARINLTVAPGVGRTRVFTWRKTSANSALAVTISGATTVGTDLVNTVSYNDGDTLDLGHVITLGSPPNTSITASWRVVEGTAAGTFGSQPALWPMPARGPAPPSGWIFTQPLTTTGTDLPFRGVFPDPPRARTRPPGTSVWPPPLYFPPVAVRVTQQGGELSQVLNRVRVTQAGGELGQGNTLVRLTQFGVGAAQALNRVYVTQVGAEIVQGGCGERPCEMPVPPDGGGACPTQMAEPADSGGGAGCKVEMSMPTDSGGGTGEP